MKFLQIFFALFLGCASIGHADQDFKAQYSKPLTVKIFSRDKGIVQEEYFRCTPQTCCFAEKSYCFMSYGECICDLERCEQWPDKANTKDYWMVIGGMEAERVCGRARRLHEVTGLCLCDPDKNPACDECNPPVTGCIPTPGGISSLPQDCRSY